MTSSPNTASRPRSCRHKANAAHPRPGNRRQRQRARASLTRTNTQRDLSEFARVSVDSHPVHLDGDYARHIRLKGPVAQGIIGLTLISAVLGSKVGRPDVAAVQSGQSVRFHKPVLPGDTVTAVCEVTHVNPERRIAVLDCKGANQHGEGVLAGERE